jgi:hypothetical protein
MGSGYARLSPHEQHLPHDVVVAPPPAGTPAAITAFAGKWSGAWHGVWPHILVVEQVSPDTSVATFAWGIARTWGIHHGGWTRVAAIFVDGALQLTLQQPATVTYRMGPEAGTLSAIYKWPGGRRYTTMRRLP